VLNVARKAASWHREGFLREHAITEYSRNQRRGVNCECSASRPAHRVIHVSLQRTYAGLRRLSR
jgi:hypothetical protein